MQVIISLVMLAGLGLFLALILWISVMTIIDSITNGLGSESQRRERDRMMGDPKDRP
jgi:hypothetical protein